MKIPNTRTNPASRQSDLAVAGHGDARSLRPPPRWTANPAFPRPAARPAACSAGCAWSRPVAGAGLVVRLIVSARSRSSVLGDVNGDGIRSVAAAACAPGRYGQLDLKVARCGVDAIYRPLPAGVQQCPRRGVGGPPGRQRGTQLGTRMTTQNPVDSIVVPPDARF